MSIPWKIVNKMFQKDAFSQWLGIEIIDVFAIRIFPLSHRLQGVLKKNSLDHQCTSVFTRNEYFCVILFKTILHFNLLGLTGNGYLYQNNSFTQLFHSHHQNHPTGAWGKLFSSPNNFGSNNSFSHHPLGVQNTCHTGVHYLNHFILATNKMVAQQKS